MKSIQILTICVLLIGISCKDQKSNDTPVLGNTTYYLIRHAEKDRNDPDDVDPELNQDGLGRAMHWAEILDEVPIDVIYSTDYNRTSMTAAPLSVKKNIDVQYFDPRTVDFAEFKKENLNKHVLIVGHSNTTPNFVNELIGEERYYQIDDHENGLLFIVQVIGDQSTVSKLKFNCNCPD